MYGYRIVVLFRCILVNPLRIPLAAKTHLFFITDTLALIIPLYMKEFCLVRG